MPTDDLPIAVRAHVAERLASVSAADRVTVLFAIESGSRAWGFPSSDSDYDVRFVYAHDLDWYLRLLPERDVIERPLDAMLVDLGGWDVRKALRLLLKSNPPLYEWLISPITYADDGVFRPAARALFERHAGQRTLAYHYHSIARAKWREDIAGRGAVKLKKYFYLLRPLLSLQWLVQKGAMPPMHIAALLEGLDLTPSLRAEIEGLARVKSSTPELGLGTPLATVNAWAEERLQALDPAALNLSDDADDHRAADEANKLFLDTLRRSRGA